MKIGIGLPSMIPGVKGQLILDWAARADSGPFSSLGVLDRLVYSGYSPLITLASAAGVTSRVRLVTTVLLTPLHNTGILAKQAASLDNLSNGRLTLGLGIGAREDDFLAAPASFHNRGKHFDEQLAEMKRIWSGQPLNDKVGPIGPPPVQQGGPEILIGGYSAAAMQRVGRWANGYISGGGPPQQSQQFLKIAKESWKAAGRSDELRYVACTYYALGPDAKAGIQSYISGYYGSGPRSEEMINRMPSTPQMIKDIMQAFASIGADELIFWPCIADLNQIDQLGEAIS